METVWAYAFRPAFGIDQNEIVLGAISLEQAEVDDLEGTFSN